MATAADGDGEVVEEDLYSDDFGEGDEEEGVPSKVAPTTSQPVEQQLTTTAATDGDKDGAPWVLPLSLAPQGVDGTEGTQPQPKAEPQPAAPLAEKSAAVPAMDAVDQAIAALESGGASASAAAPAAASDDVQRERALNEVPKSVFLTTESESVAVEPTTSQEGEAQSAPLPTTASGGGAKPLKARKDPLIVPRQLKRTAKNGRAAVGDEKKRKGPESRKNRASSDQLLKKVDLRSLPIAPATAHFLRAVNRTPKKPILTTVERELQALQPFVEEQRRRDEKVKREVREARQQFVREVRQQKAALEERVKQLLTGQHAHSSGDAAAHQEAQLVEDDPHPHRHTPRLEALGLLREALVTSNSSAASSPERAKQPSSADATPMRDRAEVVEDAIDEDALIFAASSPSRAMEEDRVLGRHAREQHALHRRQLREEQERELRFVKDKRVVAVTMKGRFGALEPLSPHDAQSRRRATTTTTTPPPSTSGAEVGGFSATHSGPPGASSASMFVSRGTLRPAKKASSGYGALVFLDGAVSDFLIDGEIRRSKIPEKFLAAAGRKAPKKAFHF